MTAASDGVGVAWVAVGSSLGDRLATLHSAVDALHLLPGLGALTCSPVYRTRPVGAACRPFLNAVVRLDFTMLPSATDILEGLLAIERAHGRTRTVRWEDRTLDLDLLAIEAADGRGLTLSCATLTIPHPRIAERDFVMRPWLDLAPNLRLPNGRALAELLAELPPDQRTILGEVPVNPGLQKQMSSRA